MEYSSQENRLASTVQWERPARYLLCLWRRGRETSRGDTSYETSAEKFEINGYDSLSEASGSR